MTGVLALASRPAVVVDIAVWAVAGVAVGYAAHRCPARFLRRDRGPTRLTGIETGGHIYERILRIRSWKRWLPDAGTVFRGGRAKQSLVTRHGADLERLAIETRRAELTHWALVALAPSFALWNPAGLTAVMVTYAVLANVPCIVVQRYNRARVERVLAARRRRRRRRAVPS